LFLIVYDLEGEGRSKNVAIFGLYGKDVGLYAPEQMLNLQTLIGVNKVL